MPARIQERWLLYALLAFAFLLRVWDLGRSSLWYDEILQANAAGGPLDDFFPQLILHAAMPLDYVIERALLILGANEFLLRFPSAAFSTLAVAIAYKLARAMFGQMTGIIAAAFLSVSSFAVLYAHEARPYSLYLFFALTSFYWMWRALQTNRLTHWLYFALSLAGAVLSHLFALFVILAQVLFLVGGLLVRACAPSRAKLFSRITRVTILGAILAALIFLAALWLTPNAQFVWGSTLKFFAFLLAPNFVPPENWYGLAPGETPPLLTLDFFYARVLENFSGGGIGATLSFIALGLIGITAVRRKTWEIVLLLVWAIVPSVLVILFLGSRGTLFATRYLIASLPAWLVLCAVGVTNIGAFVARKNAIVQRAATIALAILFVAVSLERANIALALPKEDWRAAGQILERNAQRGDAILTPGGTRVVYFYAQNSAATQNAAETVEQIAQAEKNAARVWLVFNRYVFDPGEEIQMWLAQRGAISLDADAGIQIFYWRANANTEAFLADARKFSLPNSAYAYASLAEQFARNGDWQTAQDYFARALSHGTSAQERAHVHLAWGGAARRAGALEIAAENYRAALAANENQVDAWNGLGRVYLEQNQSDAARDAFHRALGLDSNSYAALYFLAAYYEQRGQDAVAQQYYARAAEIMPELVPPP